MRRVDTELEGAWIIEPDVFGDSRGFLMELWNEQRYQDLGIKERFVQDNISLSGKGILRGLHFQNPYSQGKLVSVLSGEVFDVAVDLRRGSPTFLKWVSVVLSAENKRQFFIPAGCAHGFLVMQEATLFHYKCTDFYHPEAECAVRWNDPDLGISWPVREPVLSAKDAAAPLLRELSPEQFFAYGAEPRAPSQKHL